MPTGGDITEITVTHSELGSHSFFPKAAEDNNLDLGGVYTTDDENMIDGSGEVIWVQNRGRGSLEVVVSNDMNVRKDLEFAKKLAAHPLPGQWSIAIINGTVYGCTGKPVGKLPTNVNQSTFTLKLAAGEFKEQ